jgi:hypothetical protein
MTWQSFRPIAAVLGFNLLTLLVFVTAPVTWVTDQLGDLCFFVLCCQAMIFLGYQLGQRIGFARPPDSRMPFTRGATLVNLLFTVYLCTFLVTYAYRMDYSPFDVRAMATRLIIGLRDPRWSYFGSLVKDPAGGPVRWSVYFAISIFNQLFFIAGFLYWRRFGLGRKAIFVLLATLELFYWVATATAFGVVSMVTTLGMSSLFSARSGRRDLRSSATNALLLLVLLAGSIAFFSYNLYRRNDFKDYDITQFDIMGNPVRSDAPTMLLIPPSLHQAYIKVVLYMGQGYYHACMALDYEFRWTKFLGNNGALIALADRLGVDVWPDTYMHRLQREGIDEYAVWHTAYTWWAGDVSFYGVPVLLFCLGYAFGFSWALGIQGDFLSRVVFVIFGNMLLFLFANNTYLASVFYALMLFGPFWVVTRVLPRALLTAKGRPHAPRRRLVPRPPGGPSPVLEGHGQR